MGNNIRFILILVVSVYSYGCAAVNPNQFYIRLNQVGFLPDDLKTAVIFSEYPLFQKEFFIKETSSKNTIHKDKITDSLYSYDKFKHCYVIDFSRLQKAGSYFVEVDGKESYPFEINNNLYNPLVDSLLLFYKVQRCGPTNPYLHEPCHLSDVARVIGYNNSMVDVTGGWHDAGDYVKFLSTTAYTTYMMLFAYEFEKDKFEFDNNNNGAPDILEEARVGIDWLLRCNFAKGKLITQVQDLKDHEVGWRLPENDTLRYDRPGFVGIGKNQVGLYAAVMAAASRIWSARFYDYEFSAKLLKAAEELYAIRDNVPDIDKSASGFYQDTHFWGKLALGAIELYLTKNDEAYLNDAKIYADSAGSDFWWSWGNINSLAHYRLAKIERRFADYIRNNLNSFNTNKNNSAFSEGLPYTWGTTNTFLGISLQAILYKDITGSKFYDSLEILHRDYVLGRNPWGLSFIYNIGENFPKNLHSQVAHFRNGYLPGAVTAGPAPLSVLKQYDIPRDNDDYNYFNTDSVKYYDDKMDYITNEPTIVSNATGLFVFGYYSGKR
ncbi:MAG: glycoside hydrolase family 9 protein [Ignavibacteriaceae bacterium]